MNTALARQLAPAQGALRQWWQGLAARERRLLQAGALLLALALLWWLALGPALRTVRQAPAERDRLDAQLQQMQRLAQEAKTLRAVAPVAPAQAQAAVQAACGRLGERAKLNLQGARAVVTLQGVTSAELAALLSEVRSGARARVSEATVNQSAPGRYQGSLTLSLGAAAP